MTSVRFLPQAARDLLEIADFLSSQTASGELGERFLDSADNTASLLARTPHIGRPRPSRNPHLSSLRSLILQRPFDRYVFYYQTSETGLVILRVLHTAQSAYQLLSVETEESA